jgi:hypothetical protein
MPDDPYLRAEIVSRLFFEQADLQRAIALPRSIICGVWSSKCPNELRTFSAMATRQRRPHGAAMLETSQNRPLVNELAQSKTTACRRSRLGQQDGAHGLGRDEQTGHLPTRSSDSMNY